MYCSTLQPPSPYNGDGQEEDVHAGSVTEDNVIPRPPVGRGVVSVADVITRIWI